MTPTPPTPTPTPPPPPTPGPMVPTRWRVTARRRETHDTVTLTMAPERPEDHLAAPRPGQFHMLSAFGVLEVPISVSGIARDTTNRAAVDHTIRSVGAATEALCGLRVGDPVGVRGPFGTTWGLDALDGGPVVIMAGGIGLAPLRPVIEHQAADRRAGDTWLLVGARRPEELCFAEDLERWATETALHVLVTVDSADRDWVGGVGVITHLVDEIGFDTWVDPTDTTAFVCGPEAMNRFSVRALVGHGVPAPKIELSTERNMRCAIAHCGHCQFGPYLVCRDGPVFRAPDLESLMAVREL